MRRQRFISASVVAAICALAAPRTYSDDAVIEEVITTAQWEYCTYYYSYQQCERMFWEWWARRHDQSGLGDMGGGGGGPGPRPNEHCNVPAVNDEKGKETIRQHEGNDATTRALTLRNYGVAYDNQTGFVPPAGPNQAAPWAGITFSGVDLAQHYKWELVNMGVPSSTLNKFHDSWFTVDSIEDMHVPTPWGNVVVVHSVKPMKFYIGNRAQAEIEIASNRGTRNILTQAESEQLFVLKYEANRGMISDWIGQRYGYRFEQLPSGTQAALMDYKFKWGKLDDPILNALKDKDWATLAARLGDVDSRKNGDPKSQRAADNQAAVQSDVASGSLHNTMVPC